MHLVRSLTKLLRPAAVIATCAVVVAGIASPAWAAPSVSLSPSAGPPKSKITVSGSGFGAYKAIDIYFYLNDLALAVADGTGHFSGITIKVPGSALPGTHWVSAVQRKGGQGAQAPFEVRTDWPAFRLEPRHRAYNKVENVLDPSTVGGLDEKWTATTGSFIFFSSPAVANGTVYVGSGDDNVHALDAATGATVWTATTAGSVFASSPAVANGTVYVGSYDDDVYALDAATGATVWTATTGGSLFSSPAVANGVVYVGSNDDDVYALDAATGATVWTATTGGSVFSSPAVANGTVYVGSFDGNVYALDAATGAPVWTATTGSSVESSPAVANGVVYVGSYDHKVYALNAATGAALWTATTGNIVASSPAVVNGTVYVGSGDGKVYGYDLGLAKQPVRRPDPAKLRPDRSLKSQR